MFDGLVAGRRVPLGVFSTMLAILLMASGGDKAEAASGGTTSLRNGSAAAKGINAEAPPLTKEEQLNAKPLDWTSTIGTPTEQPMTATQEKAMKRLKPRSSAGGKPNPKAEAEARKLYPDEWK